MKQAFFLTACVCRKNNIRKIQQILTSTCFMISKWIYGAYPRKSLTQKVHTKCQNVFHKSTFSFDSVF